MGGSKIRERERLRFCKNSAEGIAQASDHGFRGRGARTMACYAAGICRAPSGRDAKDLE